MDEKGEGASVYVRISKARNEIIVYLIVALNYLALLYAIIQEILTTGKVEGYFLAGGLVMTFIIAAVIIFRKYKAKNTKKEYNVDDSRLGVQGVPLKFSNIINLLF